MEQKKTKKITERDRYEALKFYFDVCDSNEEICVSRREAVLLFGQIDRLKIPKFRAELFRRLERYLGLFYDDETKQWKPYRLAETCP